VRVAVRSALVPEMSSPAESSFVFSYTVSITNLLNDEPVQVVSRHWRIQDEEGRVEEVRGTGVVGFQPILEKGAQFEYTSQAPLRRLKGSMGGSFAVVGQTTGRVMDVPVGAFALGPPRRANANDAETSAETSGDGASDPKKDEKKTTGKGRGRRVDRSARFTKIET
jgi:ApaG protein